MVDMHARGTMSQELGDLLQLDVGVAISSREVVRHSSVDVCRHRLERQRSFVGTICWPPA